MKFLILNGPNLNLLGIREPDVYGRETYQDLEKLVADTCRQENIAFRCFQSNHEGDLVDQIQQALGDCDGIVINPAAYTHTSVALLDAVKAVSLPTVEVHISDVASREDFRQISYIRAACIATISGEGLSGYAHAIRLLKAHLLSNNLPEEKTL
ncbi:MAG: type II 3-dehydroquinate dehydratase [Pygmaiobacter massiliensis]|nr:type II 3-dehydroquinate dehydratase [Pygmaiobacter massiliensis]